jgi:hypothetical protein
MSTAKICEQNHFKLLQALKEKIYKILNYQNCFFRVELHLTVWALEDVFNLKNFI